MKYPLHYYPVKLAQKFLPRTWALLVTGWWLRRYDQDKWWLRRYEQDKVRRRSEKRLPTDG